jgi:hypothetical protein
MHHVPMLADFAVRLAFGLGALLLATSWRAVPLTFFRTHCQIILGLLVLSAMDHSRSSGLGVSSWALTASAVLAYIATVSWGLGLPRVALPATIVMTLVTAAWLAVASHSIHEGVWLFNSASRLASGFLLGAALTAMLLGHHYLTAPTMSIEPLKRFVTFLGWSLGVRGLVAGLALGLAHAGYLGLDLDSLDPGSPLFLIMRWAVGFAGPALAAVLAWKTVQIRSTQSATGILYVAMILVLVGELTSLIGAQGGGVIG